MRNIPFAQIDVNRNTMLTNVHPTKLYNLVAGKTYLVLRTEPTLGKFVEVDMKTFQSVHSPGAKI
jgi:hypothetical protein